MRQQYMYVLKLIPSLVDEANWTERENEIVSEHFGVLVKLKEDGKLIMAGRTSPMDESTMGIVVFEAGSRGEATKIMENDPAVQKGIMTAQLFDYSVALFSEGNITK